MEKSMQITPIIFGASGLLGMHLYRHFLSENPNTIGTFFNTPIEGMHHFDLQKSSLSDLSLKPAEQYIAIICASLTNIGYINKHPQLSAKTNVFGTTELIKELSNQNIPILFISSDNVYQGNAGKYQDCHSPHPVSEYGKQKLEVENQLKILTNGSYCILRLAKIVGEHGKDSTILNDIANQLMSDQDVKAASDLIFNPTAISDIISAIDLLIKKECKGTFNFCNPKSYSRLELTEAIVSELKIDKPVTPIKFSEIDPSGKRPLNTTMVNSAFFDSFKFTPITHQIQSGALIWGK